MNNNIKKITLLDGGMGQELLKRSSRAVTPMWSAEVMLHEPDLVSDVHYDFIQAGAEVITLNSYTATPTRLTREGHLNKLENLHASAIQVAKTAIQRAGKPNIQIAGCLPPLVASYKPEAALSFDASLSEYRQLVELQSSGCDFFICETMSSIVEAHAACIAAHESGKKVWVAFSVKDDASQKLRSGELLSKAIQDLEKLSPEAILLNCSKPEAINACWPILEPIDCRIGAYANGFTSVEKLFPGDTVEHLAVRQDLTPDAYANIVLSWIARGASIIGGCCEMGPAHIKKIADCIQGDFVSS